MGNMSYCRFQNTAEDLRDCVEHWDDDGELSESERVAKRRILDHARDIFAACDISFNDGEFFAARREIIGTPEATP